MNETPEQWLEENTVPYFESWAVEVMADSSGKWNGNQLRFATQEAAEAYAKDLAARWTLVRSTRVVQSPDPVTEVG